MDRKYEGLTIRGNNVVMAFSYKGNRCRETIKVGRAPTNSQMNEIFRKRQTVIYDISMGKFRYADHFPNSNNRFKHEENLGAILTIEEQLKRWLKIAQTTCQPSTLKSYNSAVYHHLIPEFGHLTLSQLKPSFIRDWYSGLAISPKRINNVMIPLRQAFRMAYEDEVINSNPMDKVRNLALEPHEPTPFSLNEITRILAQLDGQEQNLIKFAFWSGLRTSELIALEWQDIDWEKNRFYVRRAKVGGQVKTTKTSASYRIVDLNEQSLAALRAQIPHSRNRESIFLDPLHDRPWKNDQSIRKRIWISALKRANVAYRNPYQTRHTYASTMLCNGKNPMWVAHQMGHKDWGMIRNIYGRWIPNDT